MIKVMKNPFILASVLMLASLVGMIAVEFVGAANCPLAVNQSYKTADNPSVYFVSPDCKRRPIRNEAVFFSHFDSWDAVQLTNDFILNSVPLHELNFLPWGPRRNFINGSLMKTVDDPRVYLKLGGDVFPIASETAFLGMGYDWSWIEDVDPRVIGNFSTQRVLNNTGDYPRGLVFKYPNSSRIYKLDEDNRKQVRRYYDSFDQLVSEYRIDRIAILPVTQNFVEGDSVPNTFVPPPSDTSSLNSGVNPNRGRAGSADVNTPRQPGELAFRGLPRPGQVFQDPVFGTDMMRFTDAVDRSDYANHTYSQLQAFSINSEYVLVSEVEGSVARKISDRSPAPIGAINNVNTLRWWPAHANMLFFFDSNEDETIRAQSANILTSVRQTLFTFPEAYDRIRSNQSFDELSDDGRWVGGMAAMSSGDDVIFALDLVNNRLTIEMSLASLYRSTCREDQQYGIIEPDWVSASPLGNYLVVNWPVDGAARCQGQEVFDIKTGRFLGHSYDGRQHGDLTVLEDGVTEVFVTDVPNPTGNGLPALGYYTLPDGVNTPTYLRTVPWHGVWHISCRGPRGMCLVTSYEGEPGWDLRGVLESELG